MSALALAYRRKACVCMCFFLGKFFCKSHFIHCKTNTQQRKRRAELKQQREVCFIFTVLVGATAKAPG